MKTIPPELPSMVLGKKLSDEDCLLVLADLIVDSYLVERKKKQFEIETNEKKDYHKDALNKTEGLF
jgi:hypothetical protein